MGAGWLMQVTAAGVDTWSPGWYVREHSRAGRAMGALATVPASRSRLLEDSILGHRIGWFPATGLVFAEGHPSDALGGTGLACPDRLPEALCAIEQALWDHGIEVEPGQTRSRWGGMRLVQAADRLPGFAGVRRLDITADLGFDDGAQGLAVLAGVASMVLPRSKSSIWRETGGRSIETVAFYGHSGRKMLARWYDKSVEANLGPRGTLIRPEDQRRYTGETRRDVSELTTDYVRAQFHCRFLPLWRATKGVTVAGLPVLTTKLAELVEEDVLTPQEAIRAAGFLMLGDDLPFPARTARRYRRVCNDLGLVLADGVLQEVEVDLHDVLDQVLADDWEPR